MLVGVELRIQNFYPSNPQQVMGSGTFAPRAVGDREESSGRNGGIERVDSKTETLRTLYEKGKEAGVPGISCLCLKARTNSIDKLTFTFCFVFLGAALEKPLGGCN